MTDEQRYEIHGAIDELLASKEERRPYDWKRVATRARQVQKHECDILYAREYRKFVP